MLCYNNFMSIPKYKLGESAYKKQWHDRRKQKAIDILGGGCVVCGTTDNLEFDHIDPNTVEFRIIPGLRLAWSRVLKELEKCQLLCRDHHWDKTRKDRNLNDGKHGIIGMYTNRGCRCVACKATWAAYYRNRKK